MLTLVKAVVPPLVSVTVNKEVPPVTTLVGLKAAVAVIELVKVALAEPLKPVTNVAPLVNEIFEDTSVSVQGPPAVV